MTRTKLEKLPETGGKKSYVPKLIYLLVDYERTMERLLERTEEYNLQEKLERPETYRGKMLKHNHLHSMKEFVRYYRRHCLNNKLRHRAANTIFWLTRRKMYWAMGADRRTFDRHLAKLIECGFIAQKTFHGSNAACRYIINPDWIVPQKSAKELSEAFPEGVRQGKKIKISFSAGSSGFIPNCPHTASDSLLRGFPREANKSKNWESGVDIAGNAGTQDIRQKVPLPTEASAAGSEGDIHDHNYAKGGARALRKSTQSWQVQEQKKKVAPKKKDQREQALEDAVQRSYVYLVRMLYPDLKYEPAEAALTMQHIEDYILESGLSLKVAESEFQQRVMFKRNHLLRNPEYFVPRPSLWMDPDFPSGFASTAKVLEEVKKRRKLNPDYYSNVVKFGQLLRSYLREQNIHRYREAEVALGKLRDGGKLLQLFYQCALNPDEYTETIKNIAKRA